ncbi:MAG: signal recognition particle subunit SRP19/SEC65 family protein [Methermicoccaceae archaeon]
MMGAMVEREHYVLWTCYFDAECTRAMGRRVPRKLAVQKVSTEELCEACRQLSLSPIADEGARHPRTWWMGGGRVLVEKREPKQRLLREVARRIKEKRVSVPRS